MGRVPWLTLSVGGLALLFQGWESLFGGIVEYDRSAVLGGQWWRLVSGSLMHWNWAHLFWDLVAFVVLGSWVEDLSRGLWVRVVGVSALAIGLILLIFDSDMIVYRGLSGVDMALAAVWLSRLFRSSAHDPWLQGISLMIGVVLVLKPLIEWVVGAALFMSNMGPGVEVAILAHVVGMVCGYWYGFSPWGRGVACCKGLKNQAGA